MLDRPFLELVLRLWSVLIRRWVLVLLTAWFQAGSGLVGLVWLVLVWFQTGSGLVGVLCCVVVCV